MKAEDQIFTVEDQKGTQASQITDLQSLVSSLVHKVEDAKNGQKRNNIIRVVGLPEGAEGNRSAIFAETWFKNS